MTKPLLFLLFLLSLLASSVQVNANQLSSCQTLYFPLNFDQYGLPYIGITINNQLYRAQLDLGASHALHLPEKILTEVPNIRATKKVVKTTNVAGESFTSKHYLIPSMQIKCMTFDNVEVLELQDWGTKLGSEPKAHNNKDIIVGADFFNGKTITIDYKNQLLSVYSHHKAKDPTTNKANANLSFEHSDFGISISLSSGLKYYQMVLDTGASASLISTHRIGSKEHISRCSYVLSENVTCQYVSPLFMAGGLPFKSKLYLYPITSAFQHDGILGRDFFEQFVVTLNFQQNSATLFATN